jgi:ketosteroid isomerase-like protein
MGAKGSVEQRLQALEDQIAIYQVICGYGYAVDGLNYDGVRDLYAEDGVYAVGDKGAFKGRDAVAGIARMQGHIDLVGAGCAHVSTLPNVIVQGDRASATCHTMLMQHGENGFYVGRLSASRIELSRKPDGGWQIDHRQNWMLDGNPAGPEMLARVNEGPSVR